MTRAIVICKYTDCGNFNLLSLAIQGDTQRFELIERFIKVRNLLNALFSLHLDPTFEILALKLDLILVGEQRPPSRVSSSLSGKFRIFRKVSISCQSK